MANLFKTIYTGTLQQYLNPSTPLEDNALYMLQDAETGVKSMYKGNINDGGKKVAGDFIIVNGAETSITPEQGVIYYISEFGKKEAEGETPAVAGKPYVGFWDSTQWVALSDSATIDSLDERIEALEHTVDGYTPEGGEYVPGITDKINITNNQVEGSIGKVVETLNGPVTLEGSVKEQVATAKSEIIGDATEKGDTLGKLEDRIEDLESDDLKIATLTADEIAALSDANVKEAYKLINGEDRTALGNVIKVYKDSSVYGVKLTDEAIDATDEGTTDKYDNATASNDPQYLSICYEKANGKYDMVSIELKKFITESEFTNGLIVTDGKVSVNLGATNTYLKFGDETEGNKTLQANIVTLADAKAAEGATAAVTGLADALDVKTVIEENEKVTAAALNDLNQRVGKNEELTTTATVIVPAINELKAAIADKNVDAEGEEGDSALVTASAKDNTVTVASTQKLQDAVKAAESAVQTIEAETEGQEVTVSEKSDDNGYTIGVTKAAYTAASDEYKTNGAFTAEGLVNSAVLKAYIADEIAKNAVYWKTLNS